MIALMKWIGTWILLIILLPILPYLIKTIHDALKTAKLLTGKEQR